MFMVAMPPPSVNMTVHFLFLIDISRNQRASEIEVFAMLGNVALLTTFSKKTPVTMLYSATVALTHSGIGGSA